VQTFSHGLSAAVEGGSSKPVANALPRLYNPQSYSTVNRIQTTSFNKGGMLMRNLN